jgi:hypothetical protein
MVGKEVKYTLSLRDLFTGKIQNAKHATEALGGTMRSMSHLAGGLLAGIGAGFAGMEIVEFVKKSEEEFHSLEQATAQVRAGLESTRGAAGVTFEELEHGAKEAAEQFNYTQSQVADMQAQLLTFPSVTERTFGDASQSIIDMSTRLHHSLSETAIMVGKALQDPARGITALRRVGVNFNNTQTDIIKNLVATGHAAQAQKMILTELSSEFGGSAKAAADADPLFRYKKIMEDLRLTVGEAAMKLQVALAPALIKIATAFKNTIQWMQEHKTLLEFIGAIVAGALIAYGSYLAIVESIALVTKIWAGVQWLLNAAMTANPIGIMIVAIGAAVGAIIFAYKHFAKFRAVLWGVWETVKEFARIVADVFLGLGKIIQGVITLNPSKVVEGYKQTAGAIADAGTRLGSAFQKGFNDGMADFAKDEAAEKTASPKSLIKKGATGLPGEAGKGATAKATGNKSTVINIKIDSLIKSQTVSVKNVTEGRNQIKELMTQALLGAVNDSQVIAGQQ